MRKPLICVCADGFYPIDPAPFTVTERQWAKDNGERNAHILSIETTDGETLWSRVQ